MMIFKPQRARIALDINGITDPDLKASLEKLSNLQQETQNLNNGLTPQVQAAEQQLNNIITQMKNADQQLTDIINKVKTQISSLASAAVQYSQKTGLTEDEQPKFRASFIYMLNQAVGRLSQIVDTLQSNASQALSATSSGSITTNNGEFSDPNQMVQNMATPPLAPEPAQLVTSSIRSKTAGNLKSIIEMIKQINPYLEASSSSLNKNEEVLKEVNEVIGATAQALTPEPEQKELTSPEDQSITPNEVQQSMNVEKGFEAPQSEATPTEETTPEVAPVEEPTPEDEGEPAEEPVEESTPIEDEGEPAEEPEDEGEPATKETAEETIKEEEIVED